MDFLKKLFGIKKPAFPGIVAAKVIDVQKHPNADRLRVVKLDIGERVIEPAGQAVSIVEPVVCGANNFTVGDMVVLALPGATIPQNIHDEKHEPFVLEKAKIRGIESQGMICAAFELALGPLEDKPEILILKPDTRPGSQFNPDMIQAR